MNIHTYIIEMKSYFSLYHVCRFCIGQNNWFENGRATNINYGLNVFFLW